MVIYLNPFIMPIVFRFNNISFHFHSSFAASLSLLQQNVPLCFHYEIKSVQGCSFRKDIKKVPGNLNSSRNSVSILNYRIIPLHPIRCICIA